MKKKSLKNKLDRFSTHLHAGAKTGKIPTLPSRYQKLAEHTNGILKSTDAGTYCLVRQTYPWSYVHGAYQLKAIGEKSQPLSAFVPEANGTEMPVANLLFIDTETTGLGGSGTVAFLIGVGSVTAKGFEVRQYLLPDYTDEAGMLEDLLLELSGEYSVVTYNGAAFDLPLIRDRFIINRVGKEVPYDEHIDLLHAVRRLYKRRVGSCKLTNIEVELFGFERTDDVPGWLVPSVYFEWLGDESLEYMNGVLEHNRLDIVSLYVLFQQIGMFYKSCGEECGEVDDLHSLARFMHRQRQPDKSKLLFSRMTEVSDDLSPDMLLFHAMNYKRSKQWEEALPLFEQVVVSGDAELREVYRAHVELAKYYEHTTADFERALVHTEQAFEHCPYGEGHINGLKRRRLRIKKKASKQA